MMHRDKVIAESEEAPGKYEPASKQNRHTSPVAFNYQVKPVSGIFETPFRVYRRDIQI